MWVKEKIMSEKKMLISKVEHFYIDIIEEFKEVELQIIRDSKFKNVFGKKDYSGNIKKLKMCKKLALDIKTKDLDIDPEGKNVVSLFNRCLAAFNKLCDNYTQQQVFLEKKSNKEDVKYSRYKEISQKIQIDRQALNESLHDLDIVYIDYTEEG